MKLYLCSIHLLLVVGCSAGPTQATSLDSEFGDPDSGELIVFAAASLANAFPDIAEAFQQALPSVSVNFNFAGSQRLRTQLEFGAGADVFASADEKQMDLAQGSGLLSGRAVPFASNRLVVIVPKGSTGGASTRSGAVRELKDLGREGVKLALAVPEVPAGGYARAVITKLAVDSDSFGRSYEERVLANVVSLEHNVRGVVQKVMLDEVDAGMVYWTDARTDYVADRVRVIPIPEDATVAATYPVAVLADSSRPALAAAFVQFLLSEQGQAILKRHGFGPPHQSKVGARQVSPGRP